MCTWTCYAVMWHWSADTLFWQLSIDHNMYVQYQVLHIVIKCVWHLTSANMKGWTYVRTISSAPKFLGSIDYHIFLPMVLRCARESSAIIWRHKAARETIEKKTIEMLWWWESNSNVVMVVVETKEQKYGVGGAENNKNALVGVVVVEERKPWKCGNSGRGEGNNWTVDENGGLGLAGFYFYYFLFKTTTNAFLLSPVSCNNVFCFHSTTTFLFVLSLHHHLHRHHISIFFFPSPPPPLPHFNCFTTSHYDIT